MIVATIALCVCLDFFYLHKNVNTDVSRAAIGLNYIEDSEKYGASKNYKKLQKSFLTDTQKNGINSFLLIVENKKVVLQTANGVASATPDLQWSFRTKFRVANLQKLVTIISVLQLVKNNRMHLNDSVENLIPVLKDSMYKNITVKNLLLNETKQYFKTSKLTNKDSYDLLNVLSQNKSKYVFEKSTSNINYLLLALMVQSSVKESYNEYVAKHVFEKNNLNYTTLMSDDVSDAQLSKAYHHNSKDSTNYNKPYDNSDFIFGIDDLTINAGDMYELLKNSIAEYSSGGQKLVFSKAYEQAYGKQSISKNYIMLSNEQSGFNNVIIVSRKKNNGIVYNVNSKPVDYDYLAEAKLFYKKIGAVK